MKIINKRKSKFTKKQMLMAIGGMIAFLGLSSISTVKAYATENNEEVLFEDTTDDQTVEEIDSNDVVEDNTVVEDGDNQTEEQTQENTSEENKGGDCITEDHGYNEEAGKNWDPSIQTETEKKGLTPSTPPDTPETPETPEKPDTPNTPSTPETPSTPSTPETPSTPVEETVVTETPRVTPKTGDLTIDELIALYSSLGLMSLGAGAIAYKHCESKLEKSKRR
jgi:outer membrane biosynthesis protein TonB